MITLLGTLLGFIGSLAPDILKLFQNKQDAKHELAMLQMQKDIQAAGHAAKLEEIGAFADVAESKALYKTWLSGVKWVDALNGTVRPVLAYSFFFLYAGIKLLQFSMIGDLSNPLPWQLAALWTEEDQAIFAGIIAFYFGQRQMNKVRAK